VKKSKWVSTLPVHDVCMRKIRNVYKKNRHSEKGGWKDRRIILKCVVRKS